jgi:hypothetical protein
MTGLSSLDLRENSIGYTGAAVLTASFGALLTQFLW